MKIPRTALQCMQLPVPFAAQQDNGVRVWKFPAGEDVHYQYSESSLLLTSHFTSFQYSQLELATPWHRSGSKLLEVHPVLCCDKHRAIYKPASKLWANLCILFQNTGILKPHLQDQKHFYIYIATTSREEQLNLLSSHQPQPARAKDPHRKQRTICMHRPLSLRSKTWVINNSFLQISL